MMSTRLLATRLSRSLPTAEELSLISRSYANGHGGTPSSLLTSALDQKQRTSHSANKDDSVGPFQLGISQAALRRGEKVKKWSELSVGGKGKSCSTSLLTMCGS